MDSSTLLATCAGSGVTLVAILGGFLLTKYLSIASEIQAADHHVDDLTERLGIEQTQLDEAEEAFARFSLAYDMDDPDVRDLFLGAALKQEPVTLEALSDELGDTDKHDPALVEEVIAEWRAEADEVIGDPAFRTMVVAKDQPAWEEFRKELPAGRSLPDLWERYFELRAEGLRDEARKLERETRVERSFLDSLGIGQRNYLASAVSLPNVGTWATSSQQYVRRRDEERETVDNLHAQLDVARGRRQRIDQPDGILGGLAALALIFVLTVVPSLLLLAPTPATLTRTQSVALLSAYFAGVLVMFVYFGAVAWQLRRPSTLAASGGTSGSTNTSNK